MAYDAKYGAITVEHEPGNTLGDDEPVFLLRARDVTSGAVLAEWQDAHSELVKVPD